MGKYISIITSITALILSVIAVCVAAWRSPDLAFDYQGVIVGVLSLLVTALIGWQIFNVVEVNKKVSGIKETASEVTNEIMDKYSHTIKSYVITLDTFQLFYDSAYSMAIDRYIEAIDEGIKGSDMNAIELPLQYLYKIKGDEEAGNIFQGKKAKYIATLSKLKDKNIDDLINYILKSTEVPICHV